MGLKIRAESEERGKPDPVLEGIGEGFAEKFEAMRRYRVGSEKEKSHRPTLFMTEQPNRKR